MVPEGGREEPVARGEEGKPPRGQSILVSGKWREPEGVALASEVGRERVKKKGETEVCRRSIEAAETSRATREMRNRGRDGENPLPGRAQGQAPEGGVGAAQGSAVQTSALGLQALPASRPPSSFLPLSLHILFYFLSAFLSLTLTMTSLPLISCLPRADS